MAIEIEKKFLINKNETIKNLLKTKGLNIEQGYLNTDPSRTVRVRIKGDEAYITIKGLQVGISKPEYEYKIPLNDAKEMLNLCEYSIKKTRYEYLFKDKLWEIDIFHAENEGLFIAEIELKDPNEKFELPDFIKEEISVDMKYSNSNLSKNPIKKW